MRPLIKSCYKQLTDPKFRAWMKAEVQYAKGKGVGLLAYVYPILPFLGADPDPEIMTSECAE